jgi:LCP family protein required for cell wall assembly
LFGAVAFVAWIGGLFSSPTPGSTPGARTQLLFLGIDHIAPGAKSRSDTVAVISLQHKDVRVLSLARDLKLKFPDGVFRKVNAAHAVGGPDYAREVISGFLGVPLRYYVIVDYEGVAKLIDLVGGVTLDVKEPMKHQDTKQNLYIDIPAGVQRFDGAKALAYARFRSERTGGDLGRIQRQHQLFAALLQQVKLRNANLNQLLPEAMKHIKTNLTLSEVSGLVEPLKGVTPQQVQLKILSGRPEKDPVLGEVLVPDPIAVRELVDEILLGQPVVTNDDIRVLVLNGSGAPGIACATRDTLQRKHFSAEHCRNADRQDYPKTFIIDINGGAEKAWRLKQALGITAAEVIAPEKAPATLDGLKAKGISWSNLDFLLILGKDFALPVQRQ